MERPLPPDVPEGYSELAPPPDLAAWLECVWTRKAGAPEAVHRVLPDGCVDILFTFGQLGAPEREMGETTGVGAMTKPLFVRDAAPRLFIGVRFRPGRAYGAFGIPAIEATDGQIPFESLSLDPQRELDHIARQVTDAGRVTAVIELVRRRVRAADAAPLSVRAAVHRIISADGNLRVALLANEIGLTRQQLARQFATHVGLSPKVFARVMRARAVLARVDAARAAHPPAGSVNWSALALELGYYDQPHLIDDFREITGSTPTEWLKRT